MSALLEINPQDVTEQMLMRLDDIGDRCENLKAKVVVHDQQDRASTSGQAVTRVPMVVAHVSGSEPEEDDWARCGGSRSCSLGKTHTWFHACDEHMCCYANIVSMWMGLGVPGVFARAVDSVVGGVDGAGDTSFVWLRGVGSQ